jgi:hypothetical protein
MFSTLQHPHPFMGEDKGEVSHHLSSENLSKISFIFGMVR